MTKQTALNRSAQNDKKILPHHGGHTYTKSKNSLRRNHHPRHPQAHSKNLKFVSKTCPNVIVEAVFQKLDLKIPEQAKRLQARRKMISYGKNTVGYDEYIRKVPKDKRKPRCMETPSTPDYTLDMPNKRWTGQVRAWRRALHNYDPPDLQTLFTQAAKAEQPERAMDSNNSNNGGNQNNTKSVQELQLEQAKAAGLPVQFASSTTPKTLPTAVISNDAFDELDQWEDKRNSNGDLDDFVSEGDDISDDSDDDLL